MKNVAVFHIFYEFRTTPQPTITGNGHTDSPHSGGRQGGRDGGRTTICHEKQRIYGFALAHFAIYCELCSLQITYYTSNKRDEDHYPRPDEKRHAGAARYHSVYNHSHQSTDPDREKPAEGGVVQHTARHGYGRAPGLSAHSPGARENQCRRGGGAGGGQHDTPHGSYLCPGRDSRRDALLCLVCLGHRLRRRPIRHRHPLATATDTDRAEGAARTRGGSRHHRGRVQGLRVCRHPPVADRGRPHGVARHHHRDGTGEPQTLHHSRRHERRARVYIHRRAGENSISAARTPSRGPQTLRKPVWTI